MSTAGARYYLGVNRNKKSVAIDLKSDDGAALLADLIRSADVLVENFRPGALARLGFGAERARALNPRLIYCSISGYGATGPRRDLPGYDMVIQGESGLMDVTGFPETGPTKVGVAITDCLAAQYAVQGILLALISRARTGQGQVVDIALLDAAVSILGLPDGHRGGDGQEPGPPGQRPSLTRALRAVSGRRRPGHRCGGQSAPLVAVLPAPSGSRTSSTTRALRPTAIASRTAPRSTSASSQVFVAARVDELIDRLTAAGVPCGRVRSIDDVLRDPQLAARNMLRRDTGRRDVGARAGEPRQAVGRAGAAARAAAGAWRAHRRRSATARSRS